MECTLFYVVYFTDHNVEIHSSLLLNSISLGGYATDFFF